MIILQILAAIFLVPLTIALLILFNIYVIQRIYLLVIALFVLIYSSLCALVWHDVKTIMWVFTLITILYIARMGYLRAKLLAKKKGEAYPFIRGHIRAKKEKFYLDFLFPLGFLNILKIAPRSLKQKIATQTGMNIEIPELIEMIREQSIGTRIDISTDDATINFEVK